MSKALIARVEALERARGVAQELLFVLHDSDPSNGESDMLAGYRCTVSGEEFEVRREYGDSCKKLAARVEAQARLIAPAATFVHGYPIYGLVQ